MKWELAWQNSTVNQATHDPWLFAGAPVCGPIAGFQNVFQCRDPPERSNAGLLDVFHTISLPRPAYPHTGPVVRVLEGNWLVCNASLAMALPNQMQHSAVKYNYICEHNVKVSRGSRVTRRANIRGLGGSPSPSKSPNILGLIILQGLMRRHTVL